MTKKLEEINAPKAVPRESDNPIVEEYKEELLTRPAFGVHPATAGEEARLCRMESLLAEMRDKVDNLERRLKALEGRRQ
ncbi:MAG: hypothetical protein QUS07_02315 [Methanothrix sp.]|nr:hypothetical protein [Methanothrix sp.]